MASIIEVFSKNWPILISLLIIYLFIILIIEIKDQKLSSFTLRTTRHEYKETKNWYQINNLFLQEYKMNKNNPIENILMQIQRQFKKLILINLKESRNNVTDNEMLEFIDNMVDEEVKFFLKDPILWLNKSTNSGTIYFVDKNLMRNKKLYKEVLPNLLRLEKSFFQEVKLNPFENRMLLESDLYKQF